MKARQFQSREMWLSDIKIILVYSESAGVVNPSMLLMGVAWSCFSHVFVTENREVDKHGTGESFYRKLAK